MSDLRKFVESQLTERWGKGWDPEYMRGYDAAMEDVAAMAGWDIPTPRPSETHLPCSYKRDGVVCRKPIGDPVHPMPDERMSRGRHVYR